MLGIDLYNVPDLPATTLRDWGKQKYTNLRLNLQRYVAYEWLIKGAMKKDAIVVYGDSAQRNIDATVGGSFAWVGAFADAAYGVNSGMTAIRVPTRFARTYWVLEWIRDIVNAPDAAKVYDIMKLARERADDDVPPGIETAFWAATPPPSTDVLTMWGIAMWIVPNATTGFNGGNPTGYSSGVGGVDFDTLTNGKNYTGTFASIEDNGSGTLVDEMRTMAYKTSFMAPFDRNDYSTGKSTRSYASTFVVKKGLDRLAKAQNSQNGYDLDAANGKTTLNGNPVQPIPELDSGSLSNPVYQIDWSRFHPITLPGMPVLENKGKQLETKDTVTVFTRYLCLNTLCDEKRTQGVLYQA